MSALGDTAAQRQLLPDKRICKDTQSTHAQSDLQSRMLLPADVIQHAAGTDAKLD